MNDPEQLMKISKKGKTLMMFVKVKPHYKKDKVDELTKFWQSSLHNSHIQAERLVELSR